jgi:hypothetical protein
MKTYRERISSILGSWLESLRLATPGLTASGVAVARQAAFKHLHRHSRLRAARSKRVRQESEELQTSASFTKTTLGPWQA